jgi:pimeloyl-ACP methyl ester carboxylesterase
LHGITSFGGTWEWIVPELAERFRVLRLDFRGHGASDRAPGGYHVAGYVSDAVTVCEQLLDGPALFMGHSLGGVTTAIVMQQRPDLVRAAILEDPPLRSAHAAPDPGRPLDDGHAMVESFRMMRQTLPGIQAAGMTADAVAELLASAPGPSGTALGASIHADGLRSTAGSLLAVDPTVLDPVLEGRIDLLLDPDGPFDAPTLIVTADPERPDAVADPSAARHFASISPATEVLTVPGAGHLVHDEIASRDAFRSAVLAFLGRVAP